MATNHMEAKRKHTFDKHFSVPLQTKKAKYSFPNKHLLEFILTSEPDSWKNFMRSFMVKYAEF